MSVLKNKKWIVLAVLYLYPLISTFGEVIELNGCKLEILENSGRFKFYKKNEQGEYVSLISATDPRTSSFSIYDNDIFYKLGDSIRYKKEFHPIDNGGEFIWTTSELHIKQSYVLDSDGFLEINFVVTNVSLGPKVVGFKYMMDTTFENDDYFYLMNGEDRKPIKKEYELDKPGFDVFWTSGARNDVGVALMSVPALTKPSRMIFGNWDILDEADYFFKSSTSRDFNNPPYSINDTAILNLYSPVKLLSEYSINYQVIYRAFESVQRNDEIIFYRKGQIISKVPKKIEEEQPILLETPSESAIDEPLEEVSREDGPYEEENQREQLRLKKIETIKKLIKLVDAFVMPSQIDRISLDELDSLILELEKININENQ